MKTINTEELVKLIQSLTIKSIKIDREVDRLDLSTASGREFDISPTGEYTIIIHGYQEKSE